jgi:hypothetical protein
MRIQLHKLLFVIFSASTTPVLVLLLSDVFAEWNAARAHVSTDVPQHAAMAALASDILPYLVAMFLLSLILAIYILVSGAARQRIRVGEWYALLFLVIALLVFGPHASQFPLRLYFSVFQTLCVAPLVVLPMFWVLSKDHT